MIFDNVLLSKIWNINGRKSVSAKQIKGLNATVEMFKQRVKSLEKQDGSCEGSHKDK